MKKHLILALILAFAATGAFAIDIVAGMMLNTLADRTIASEDVEGSWYSFGYKYTIKEKNTGFGVYGSVGWKYLDFNTAIFLNTAVISGEGDYSYWEDQDENRIGATLSPVWQLGAYFKVPITFSDSFRLFPTVGTDFGIGGSYIGLFMGGGVGADLILIKNMFLRGTILGGYDIFKGGSMVFKIGAGWLL